MDIKQYLQVAKKHDKKDKIILGYIYNDKVYYNIINDYMVDRVCFKVASKKNGAGVVLALKPLTIKHKIELVKTACVLCNANEFITNGNKGNTFEKMIRELNGIQHKHDSIAFYKGCDMVVNGIGYSIKWENAQLYPLKVLDRLQGVEPCDPLKTMAIKYSMLKF